MPEMTKDRSALIEALVPQAAFAPSDPRGETPAALAQRLADSGYLFLRGLVDPAALTTVRADILELCARDGWLDAEAPRSQGVWSGMPFPDHQTYMRLYRDLIRLDSFNRLSATPTLIAALSAILGGPVFAHRRNIARISFPGNAAETTQPHQDHFYIRGSTETYTLWIPTSDCPTRLGSLAVLEGSHRLGFQEHVPTIGAGGSGVRTEQLGLRWIGGDFRLGDALLFHSHTIHAALENQTSDRLRISLDYRYQRIDTDIDPSSMEPHGG